MECIDFGPDADMIVADCSTPHGPANPLMRQRQLVLPAHVSGNGGRLVVHDWHAESLVNVQKNIKAWRENLQAPDVFHGGQPAPVPSVYWLIRAIMTPV